VITITGFGDHNQPEWLIIFTGIRTGIGPALGEGENAELAPMTKEPIQIKLRRFEAPVGTCA